MDLILDSGSKTIILHKEGVNQGDFTIIYNTLQKDSSNSEKEAVEYIYRQLRNAEPPDLETARGVIDKLFFSEQRYDLGEVGRFRINRKLEIEGEESRTLTTDDIIRIIKTLLDLVNSNTDVDDIDHLSNRRIRTVGEQLYSQFGVGLARMARTIRERMNVRDNEVFTPDRFDQRQDVELCDQQLLWHQPAVSVHGPNQPAERGDAQASHLRVGSRWFEP